MHFTTFALLLVTIFGTTQQTALAAPLPPYIVPPNQVPGHEISVAVAARAVVVPEPLHKRKINIDEIRERVKAAVQDGDAGSVRQTIEEVKAEIEQASDAAGAEEGATTPTRVLSTRTAISRHLKMAHIFKLLVCLWALMGLASTQPLPQKTKVIKIGYAMPFSINYNPTDPVTSNLQLLVSLNTVLCYDVLLWWANRVNQDPSILPDTRIELVPINTLQDRGTSLNATLELATRHGVAAVIGEAVSRNTVTMAVATSVNNVLHCANLASTPQLSNKADYPTSFRTQSASLYQARAMLALVTSFNVTTVSVLSSNDEFGQGVTQQLQSLAPLSNVTLQVVVPFDVTAASYVNEWNHLVANGAQTVLVVAAQFEAVRIMTAAQQVGVLDGSVWIISSLGWDQSMFGTSAAAQLVLGNMTGVWQISPPLYYDAAPNGQNADAVAARQWWDALWIPNNATTAPGFPIDWNPRIIQPWANATLLSSNCANDSQLSIASQIPRFMFQLPGNPTPLGGQGDQCISNGRYLLGYAYLLAALQGYNFRSFNQFMWSTITCGRILTGVFDAYTKSGRITTEEINQRRIMSLFQGNITRLINGAGIPHWNGGNLTVDNGGDLVSDQRIQVYMPVQITPTKRNTVAVPVGQWNVATGKIDFTTNQFVFLGGKTAPPPPRQIPRVPYEAKMALRYAFDAIVGLCSLFTILLGVYMYMNVKMKIFVASAPRFLTLIIVGANISFISIWLFSQYPMNDSSCIVYGWLKYMGFATVFGALILKTYRISVIFTQKKIRKSGLKLNDTTLFMYFAVFLCLWAALMIVWTVIPSQRPYLQVDSLPILAKNGTIIQINTTPHCNFGSYNYINLAAMIITLTFGVALTWSIRQTPSAFNESRWIAFGLYNWVVIGVVLNAISNFAVSDPDTTFVMEALTAIITQTGVVGLLFVPKIIEIMAGRGNNNETFQSTGQSSDGKTSANSVLGANSGLGTGSFNGIETKKVDELQIQLKTKDAQLENMRKEMAELKKQMMENAQKAEAAK
ncbi:hypothetical protein HDV05_000480 [Chytridiales sp. JEL 0842]|nr:hypothetical protein HDV05_000480 [Chytridiales sp. JEL 0842]